MWFKLWLWVVLEVTVVQVTLVEVVVVVVVVAAYNGW